MRYHRFFIFFVVNVVHPKSVRELFAANMAVRQVTKRDLTLLCILNKWLRL